MNLGMFSAGYGVGLRDKAKSRALNTLYSVMLTESLSSLRTWAVGQSELVEAFVRR